MENKKEKRLWTLKIKSQPDQRPLKLWLSLVQFYLHLGHYSFEGALTNIKKLSGLLVDIFIYIDIAPFLCYSSGEREVCYV